MTTLLEIYRVDSHEGWANILFVDNHLERVPVSEGADAHGAYQDPIHWTNRWWNIYAP